MPKKEPQEIQSHVLDVACDCPSLPPLPFPAMLNFKCLLQPHSNIPPPVLAILVGRLPTAITPPIEDGFERKLEDGVIDEVNEEEGDAWEEDWGWGDEEDTKTSSSHAGSNTNEKRRYSSSVSSHPAGPTTEPYMISPSGDGIHMVLAHNTKFLVLRMHEEENQMVAVGQGSGCEDVGETITAILCLPLFVPSIRKSEIFVLVGYSTGWIRFFTQSGMLLTSQLLDMSPVLTIRLRTPPPVVKLPPRTQAPATDDEEITILFQGGRVVSIDGQSLWMVLRVCDGQRESGIDVTRGPMSFTYKKWSLQGQIKTLDVVSCGPSSTSISHITGLPSSLTSHPFNSLATARYIAVGTGPTLSYYTTTDSSRPLLSAVSMATLVVSKVTNAVFSFARSWWLGPGHHSAPTSRPTSRPTSPAGDGPVPASLVPAPPPVQIAPATPITSTLSFDDPNRRISQILLSPPTVSSAQHSLAVTMDSLGRVMLLDVEEGEIVRMFKGVRGAVCGWVEVLEEDLRLRRIKMDQDDDTDTDMEAPVTTHKRVLLFLVIHSPRRGILEIYHMRHARRVGFFYVGIGWRLVACGGEPLGSAYVGTERRRTAARLAEEKGGRKALGLAKCLLVGPNGEIKRVEIMNA